MRLPGLSTPRASFRAGLPSHAHGLRAASLLAAALALGACGDGPGGATEPDDVPDAPASVVVQPAVVEIFTPESRQLTAEVRDAGGNLLTVPVEWTSSNGAVVSVDAAGLIAGTGAGEATVEARAGEARGTAAVRVLAPMDFGFPLLGTLNEDFYYTNYVDLQPGSGFRDFRCGPKAYDGHAGTDIVLPNFALMDRGVQVVAAAPGRVVLVQDGLPDRNKSWDAGGGLGNHVVIEHRDGFRSYYGHMRRNSIIVTPNQMVEAGTVLGDVGSSGMSDMPHLHIEFRRNGVVVDAFAGPCGAAFTHWAAPHGYQDALALIDAGTTNVTLDLDVVKDPPPPVHTFRTTDPRVYIWIQLHNVRAGTTTRFELYRPGGELYRTFTIAHSEFFSMSWWWFWHDIPGYLTEPGTWRVVFRNNDTLLGDLDFELVAGAPGEPSARPSPSGRPWGTAGGGLGSRGHQAPH